MLPDALAGALKGVRVLSLEQAVALPFATRHLAHLGAEVIRVQTPDRARPIEQSSIELIRSKRQVGLNLGAEGGPETFLKLAAACDVVAHNFTPRVVRKFGIDYEGVRAVNDDVIYVSLTGFGTTGPWGERPLFGPGAEAVGGHNLLIGDPEGWPGRPGTGVYADDTCGLYATFAILAALEERGRTGAGQHIDISLYETMVAHLGPVLAEQSRGVDAQRVSNGDARFAIHGVFDARGLDRHVAVAATEGQLDALSTALGISSATPATPASQATVAAAISELDAEDAEARLVAAGIAASITADAHDTLTDPHLWERQFFEVRRVAAEGGTATYPHQSAAWGGHTDGIVEEPRYVGQDNEAVLRDVAGCTPDEIARLVESGAIGSANAVPTGGKRAAADNETRIKRGELSRVDAPTDWGVLRDR